MSRRYKIALAVASKTPGVCYYCGTDHKGDFHIDHFQAKAKGGKTVIENLVPSCANCNQLKGHKTVEQFRELVAVGVRFTDRQNEFLHSIGLLPLLTKIVTDRLHSTYFWFEVRPDLTGKEFNFVR